MTERDHGTSTHSTRTESISSEASLVPQRTVSRTSSGGTLVYDIVEEERQSIVRGRRHHVPSKDVSSGKTVFEQMRDAEETSVSFKDLLGKVTSAIITSWPFLIIHSILLTLPIAMIAIGGSNYTQCSSEQLLPLWLIVFGIVLLFFLLIQMKNVSGIRQLAQGEGDGLGDPGLDGEEEGNGIDMEGAKYFNILLLIFLLCWFGWGNYLVLHIYPPSYSMPSGPPYTYCTKSLYMFSLVLLLVVYIFLISLLLLFLCVACVWQKKRAEYDDINGN